MRYTAHIIITLTLLVSPMLSIITDANNIAKISGDCDAEFATDATQLATEHIPDQSIIEYIHAVMSSCNKAPIQKMAEASVFLLHKGTVTPKVMGQIRDSFDRIQKRRETEMSSKMSQLPPEMYSTAQKIRQIATSAGLSGNERRQQIEQSLAAVPGSYQFRIMQIFEEKPAKMDGESILETPDEPLEVKPPPPSFAISSRHQQVHPPPPPPSPTKIDQHLTIPHVKMPFSAGASASPNAERVHLARPLQISASQQNVLFPDLPPVRPIVRQHQNQEVLRGLLDNPNLDSILKTIVQKGAKIAETGPMLPTSVGSLDRNNNQARGMEALMSPSMWSDAAKYLTRSGVNNDLPTALSQFFEKNGAAQVFAPQNFRQHDGALDKYDTHIDRFAKTGPANRFEISNLASIGLPQQGGAGRPVVDAIQPGSASKPVETIVGAMPTMSPANGYNTYAPAPAAIVPQVVRSPEEITGSYRQPIQPILNQRLANGQIRHLHIDAINEQ